MSLSLIRRLTANLVRFESQRVCYGSRVWSGRQVIPIWRMSSFAFSSVNDLKVEHNHLNRQFFIQMGKDKAVLDYKEIKGGVLELHHTEVPKTLRGKGIGAILAK
ncbi:unnamed protein product, partial [Oppiella nova]